MHMAMPEPAGAHTRRTARRGLIGLCAGCALLTASRPACAQTHEYAAHRPGRMLQYWGVNVLISGATAWLQGRPANEPVRHAIAAGLVGGSAIYAGQLVMTSGERALRLAGIELTAIGASATRNLARGDVPWSELTLPLYPLYFTVRPGSDDVVQVRLSALALGASLYMAGKYRTAPDPLESLLTGAAVFPVAGERLHCYEYGRSACVAERLGQHLFGAIAYARDGLACSAHELAHLSQHTRDAVLYAVPASDQALGHLGAAGRWLRRFVVVDAFVPISALNLTGGDLFGCGAFYECEARALTVPVGRPANAAPTATDARR